jgi:hypothetical protein
MGDFANVYMKQAKNKDGTTRESHPVKQIDLYN